MCSSADPPGGGSVRTLVINCWRWATFQRSVTGPSTLSGLGPTSGVSGSRPQRVAVKTEHRQCYSKIST